MTPEIRLIRPADLDAVLAIAAAAPEAPAWQPSGYAAYLSPPQSPLLRAAFVAVNSRSVVGFAAATLLLEPPSNPNPENRCELDSIAVDPTARRHGIASALLDAVLAWAAEHRSHHFALEVRASNAAAIHLYQRHGLRREGLRPGYYRDPVDDAVLLGKPLLP